MGSAALRNFIHILKPISNPHGGLVDSRTPPSSAKDQALTPLGLAWRGRDSGPFAGCLHWPCSVYPEYTCTASRAVVDPLAQQAVLFKVDYYNGAPSNGQNVGLVTGTLLTTTVDSLGWNSPPFTFIDEEERRTACAGPLSTSDKCLALTAKIQAVSQLLASVWSPPAQPSVTSLSALTRVLLSFALICTGLQVTAAFCRFTKLTKDATTAFVPLVLVACAFFIMLTSFFTPPLSNAGSSSSSLNQALISTFVSRTISLGGLWWGGAQTIFGLQAVLQPLVPLPLAASDSTCTLTTESNSLRAGSVATICLSFIAAMIFRSEFAKVMKAITSSAATSTQGPSAPPTVTVNPVLDHPVHGEGGRQLTW